jgi:chromosome segregation ATPase
VEAPFAEYVDRVRAQRAEMRESMVALEGALADEETDRTVVRRRLRAALTELASDLRDHVALTESAEGLYAELRETAPRLGARVDAQLAEHEGLLGEVDRLLEERDVGLGDDAAVTEHRAAAADLLERVARHRRRGADLLHEAWDVDLGGSD